VWDTECPEEVLAELTAEMQGFEIGVIEFAIGQRNTAVNAMFRQEAATLLLHPVSGSRKIYSRWPVQKNDFTHSADNACVPANIRFFTSPPSPSVLIRLLLSSPVSLTLSASACFPVESVASGSGPYHPPPNLARLLDASALAKT